MPRFARKKATNNIYHVVIRGADHQLIFQESKDYRKYLDLLEYYKTECSFDILAYCLMNNHIHLLIHSPVTSLESIFRHINTAYAVWFNMKYNRTGYLQQGRYYSEPVETTPSLLNVIRYIHQNPQKAGLELFPGESYPWSSLPDYQKNSSTLISIPLILSLVGDLEYFLTQQQTNISEKFIDIQNIRKRLPDDVARNLIQEECNCNTVTDFQKLSLSIQNKYLIRLHEKGISIRQLNRLTGISKGIIQRILKKK